MKRPTTLIAAFGVVLSVVLPFLGTIGPGILAGMQQDQPANVGTIATHATATTSPVADLTSDTRFLAERRSAIEATGLACDAALDVSALTAAGRTAGDGVIAGTTSEDIVAFAARFNEIRVENCLQPVPAENFRHDRCMEDRLIWMAEDPSDDSLSAWGHTGTERSDGVPSVGCDGNLAGGSGDTGATVAEKWWGSSAHRASLYNPRYEGAIAGVCIYFAATHGGVGVTSDEASDFVRAAARWGAC